MISPYVETIVSILCTKPQPVFRSSLAAYVLRNGLSGHRSIKCRLICILLGLNASFPKALDSFLRQNEHLQSSLVSDLIKGGDSKHAIALYKETTKKKGLILDKYALLSLIKVCAERKDVETSCALYRDVISNKGLLSCIGNAMINLCTKCGMVRTAQEVFEEIPVRDVVSWNSLIIGYARAEDCEKALACLHLMQIDGISPDAITYVSCLKACGNIGDTETGMELEVVIGREGLLMSNLIIGNALINMYAQCGLLKKAQQLFEDLPIRDLISWNIIITGYSNHEKAEKALTCFEEMELEGFVPSIVTYVCILKSCGLVNDLYKGEQVHDNISRRCLIEQSQVIANALINMYVKCGCLGKALAVFNMLKHRDVSTWNALIAGYVDFERGDKALLCFKQMQLAGVSPDVVTYVSILKACVNTQDVLMGIHIHAEVSRRALTPRNLVLGTALVDMYIEFRCLSKAQEVFNSHPNRDVVLWNTLIGGYVMMNECENVLNCLGQMEQDGLSPNPITIAHCLKACGSIGNTERGREIHEDIVKKGFFEAGQIVGNALVGMYARCGMLAEAQEVFHQLLVRDVVTWTTLITGYIKYNCGEEALECIEQMQLEGNSPDIVAMTGSLNACANVRAVDKGENFLKTIIETGLLEVDAFVGCALIDMYAKCRLLSKAQEVFDSIPVRDTVSWNALISGYIDNKLESEALNCFEHMRIEGASPDITTYACILKLFGYVGDIQKGQKMHAHIGEKILLQENIFLANTLIDMYMKCGHLAAAEELFEKLPTRDIVSWNALMTGYAMHECNKEVLNLLEVMEMEGVCPDDVTYLCSLKACGIIGAKDRGTELYSEISRRGFLERDNVIGNALVEMYAKCGSLSNARELFEKLPCRDIVSWNSLISGYALTGDSNQVFALFGRMREEVTRPDPITFVGVLNACSHLGLIEEGMGYFEAMNKDYGIVPALEHHTCMIDLLAYLGHLDEAQSVVRKLPFYPDHVVWYSILKACHKWGNIELGKLAFKCNLDGGSVHPTSHVLTN